MSPSLMQSNTATYYIDAIYNLPVAKNILLHKHQHDTLTGRFDALLLDCSCCDHVNTCFEGISDKYLAAPDGQCHFEIVYLR